MREPTIEVLDLVTEYEDENFQDRTCYYTYPEYFLPRVGERVIVFLNTQSRPEGVLGNYYDALIMLGGPDIVKWALGVTHPDAMNLTPQEQSIRDHILEVLRLWMTEELSVHNEHGPIKLWIRIGPDSWKYKLVLG